MIEGTGRTTDVPIQTATMLESKGYETKMYVTAVPKIESYLGTIERYETMYADDPMTARATPKQAHDIVVKNLPINLETLHKTGLFSDIRLYIEQKMVQNQHQETPEFKAIQQKMESLQPPTPPIRGHWNIHTENSGRKPNNYWAIKLVVRFFCLAFSILVD
ncbi:MAG: zeta toxin family protein [Klebsiella grimontii]|nr:zeta toxin family protein [Klebsiella grimontii]